MGSIPADFQDSDRFQVKDHLGSGTSGEVYCVYDTKLRSYVALETLQRADPAAIYRFKNEFRALTDVNHPNLVQLYELQADGDRWFFTMELVEGLDFLEFCRGEQSTLVYDENDPASAPPDLDRVRSATRQLAQGLVELHRAGKLHCDIKPTNIRVTPEGRVVLLDFGLVQELFPGHGELTVNAELTGTPAYMSPEQAAGLRLNEATDWYAVGIVLYEALTGRRPFYGGFLQVLQQKQVTDPASPQALVPDLPADLTRLCERLLRRDPARRMTGDKVLRLLGARSDRTLETQRSSISGEGVPLIGREWHLARLAESFERSRRGQAVLVYVHGSPGVGKTALVHQFLKQVKLEHDDVVILTGRCYEREAVPYKALDSLIDALSHYLLHLGKSESEALLPTDVQALGRLFPALRRIQSVMRGQRRVLEIPDEREQKRRARTALRELWQRLARRRPLVLFIDDLHWGDRDSADLLSEMLRPPDPPPLLLVGSYRSEEKETSPLLRELLASQPIREGTLTRDIAVEELTPEDAAELAFELFGDRSPGVQAVVQVIARESQGSPYFIAELARYALTQSRGPSGSVHLEIDSVGMSISRLILSRLEQLSPEAVRLLEMVAVAGQPVALRVAIQAAELGAVAQAAVTTLRAASLIRIRRAGSTDEIEPYHTRIREEVLAVVDPDARRRYHGSLALALEASGRADPETLAVHFREAGNRENEARYVVAAADQASAALAFDRAARLYRSALDLSEHLPARSAEGLRRELLIKLGDALTNSGRGAAAAHAYLEAVPGSQTAEEALELRRQAAEQQLLSGHFDEGLETVRQVLDSIGMSMPDSSVLVLASIAWGRLLLMLRGMKFKERDASEVPQDQLLRIDACRSVATGLANVEPVRGMDFATRHLRLALKAGEPYRVARAFAIEAGFSGAGGTRTLGRTARLLETGRTLAEKVNHPNALALSQLSEGLAAYLEGRGHKALEIFEHSEVLLRESCTGVAWELDSLMQYKYRLLCFLGRAGVVREQLPAILMDAEDRGDLYAEAYLRSSAGWFMRLAADQPDKAEAEIRRAREIWSQEGFHLEHYMQLVGRVEIALYRGDRIAAWPDLTATWPALVRSQLLRVVELTRAEAWHLRCRGALASVVARGRRSAEGKKVLGELRRFVRTLGRQTHPWGRPWTHLIKAGLASFEGAREEALDHLVAAAAGFDNQHLALYAAVSRRRRGQVLGPEGGGDVFIDEADVAIQELGFVDPARMADVCAPGLWL